MDLGMNQMFREKFPEIEVINLTRMVKTEDSRKTNFLPKNDIPRGDKIEPEMISLNPKCDQGSQTNSNLVCNLPKSDSEPGQWACGIIENETKMELPSTSNIKTEKIDTETLDFVPMSGQGSQNNSSRNLPSSHSELDRLICGKIENEVTIDFEGVPSIKTEKIDTKHLGLVPMSNQGSQNCSSHNLPRSISELTPCGRMKNELKIDFHGTPSIKTEKNDSEKSDMVPESDRERRKCSSRNFPNPELDRWTCNRIENEVKMEPLGSPSTKTESTEPKIDFECVTIKEEPVEDFVDESAMSKDSQTDLTTAMEGSKPKLYNCSECSKGFDLQISLEKHELTHREFVTCDKCHLKFATKGELKQHSLKNHNDSGNIHICQDCGRAFRFKSSYLAHSICHTKDRSFVCDVCSKEFKQKYSLDKHKLIHTGIKPHVCKICSKGFTLSGNLIQHMRTHTAEKPYVCGLCSKKFGSEPELNKHFNKHRGGQSFVCDFCAKPFNWKSDLARHRRIHTGDKPYTCSTCNKGFSQKQNLANHELIHLGIKPNECEVCQKSFSAKSALTAHMWSKHQIFIDKKALKKVQPNDSSNSNSTDS